MKTLWRTCGIVMILSILGSVGCKKKLDETRQQWLDSASACPAPATCSAKMNAAAREVSVCAPFDKKGVVAGDVVVVKELGGAHETVGRISERKAGAFRVEFPDGFTLDRTEDVIVGRVCR